MKGKSMEFNAKLKLSSISLFTSILQSPFNTFLTTAAVFLVSILFFGFVYMFLHHFHQVSIVNYKGKNIIGSVLPLPAFHLSDALKKRIEVQAKNDLRLRDFIGESTNIAWQGFSQDNSLSRQFPEEKEKWNELRDFGLLGLSPSRMVDEIFPRYGHLKYKVISYRDNSFETIFPIKVMQEYFEVKSVVDLQNRIALGQLNSEEAAIYNNLVKAAPQIKNTVFQPGAENKLIWLSEAIKNFANQTEIQSGNKVRFREIFYGEILYALAPPGANIDFYFDSLQLAPEPLDFFYMSTTLATSNVPSEITPVTTDVRLIMWIQLMVSYFVLALNVAALIKILKIA